MIRIVLRTCDKASLQSSRIVNKRECVLRCFNSLLKNIRNIENCHLHVIDDNSSETLRYKMQRLAEGDSFVSFHFIDGNPFLDSSNPKKISRHSVKIAYDYIYNLPDDDLVYIVEDDYLHYDDALLKYISTWNYLNSITPSDINVGIFTQCFPQLFYLPGSSPSLNEVYLKSCDIIPTPDGYYRTTWYTHESFMIESKVFKKYKDKFDEILKIGDDVAYWEGNTFCSVWNQPDFRMFMPLYPHVMHMSTADDVPFYSTRDDILKLWEDNKTFLSLEQESLVVWSQENLQTEETK